MTRSARAAALRSTALATSLALCRGIVGLCGRKRSPSPRFHCRSRGRSRAMWFPPAPRLPRRPLRRQDRRCQRTPRPLAAAVAARHPPAGGLPPPPPQTVGAGRDRRDVVDLAGRYRGAGKRHRAGAQAQAGGCDAGAGRDIRSGREETRGMDHPAQRGQRRVGRALPRLHLAPIQAGPRRLSCAGASKRRCGTTVATTPPSGHGSKTNRRCRPRASSRWRAR